MDNQNLSGLKEALSSFKKSGLELQRSFQEGTRSIALDLKKGASLYVSDFNKGVKLYAEDFKRGASAYSKDFKEGVKLYAEDFKKGASAYSKDFKEGAKLYIKELKAGTKQLSDDLKKSTVALSKSLKEATNQLAEQAKQKYKKETSEGGIVREGLDNINKTLSKIKSSVTGYFKRERTDSQKERLAAIQQRFGQFKNAAAKITEGTAKAIQNVFGSSLFKNLLKGLGLLALFLSPESIAKAIKTVAEGFVKLAKLINSEEFKQGLNEITEFLGNVVKFGLDRVTQLLDGISGVAKNLGLLFDGKFGEIDWGDFAGDIGNVAAGMAGLALILAPAGTLMAGMKLLGTTVGTLKNAIGSVITFINNRLPKPTNAQGGQPSTRTSTTTGRSSSNPTGNRTAAGANMPGNPGRTNPTTTTPARGPLSGIRDSLRGLRRPRNLALLAVSLFETQLQDMMVGVYGSMGLGIGAQTDDELKRLIRKEEENRANLSRDLGYEMEMTSFHSMLIREAQRRGMEGYQSGGMVTVPGSGTGDIYPAMLPAGSFVLNRKASNHFFQTGGMVPTMLEPGEKVFAPGSYGTSIMAMNNIVPRFQTGGMVPTMLEPGEKVFTPGSWGPSIMAMNNIVPRFQTGGIVEHLHGDQNRSGYRADHGTQSNAHDHFAFSTPEMMRQVRDALSSGQTQSGRRYTIGSQNDGVHAPNSYHYSDQAFDIPWSQFGSGPIKESDYQQSRQLAADVRGILQSLQASSPASIQKVSTQTTSTNAPSYDPNKSYNTGDIVTWTDGSLRQFDGFGWDRPKETTQPTQDTAPTYDPNKSYNTGDLVTWTDGSIRQFDGMGWDKPENISTSVNAPTRQPGMPGNPFSGLGAFAKMFDVLKPLFSLGNSFLNNMLGGAAMATTETSTRSETTTDTTSNTDSVTTNTSTTVDQSQQKPKAVYDYMRNLGLTENHAKGLLANAIRESSLNPAAVGDGGTSFGLFQWHADRATKMKSALGSNWKNWKEQIKYALREPGEPGQQWRGMTFASPQAAADWWMKEWERSANSIRDSRRHAEILKGLGFQKGGVVGVRPQPEYKISPSASSSEFSAATQMSRLNGMYDMKSKPVIVTVPQAQPKVTGAATSGSSVPVLASSPRSAVAFDYMFRSALSQAIHA